MDFFKQKINGNQLDSLILIIFKSDAILKNHSICSHVIW